MPKDYGACLVVKWTMAKPLKQTVGRSFSRKQVWGAKAFDSYSIKIACRLNQGQCTELIYILSVRRSAPSN